MNCKRLQMNRIVTVNFIDKLLTMKMLGLARQFFVMKYVL